MTNDDFKQLYEEKRNECDSLKREIQVLKQDKASLESMVDELQELCDECSAETDRLAVSNEELEMQKLELEEEIERIKQEHGKQSSSYIEQIQNLNKDMSQFKQLRVQLETQVEKQLRKERLIVNRADKAEKNLYDKAEEVVMLKSQLEDEKLEYKQKILRLNREVKDSEDNNRVLKIQIDKLSSAKQPIRVDPNIIQPETRREVASSDFLDWRKLGIMSKWELGGEATEGSSQAVLTHYGRFETALSDALVAGEIRSIANRAIEVQCSQSEI